ncbi:MAG: SDR family NAD(P)-dependent oxidoreductase, partial [Muribaculaceae bacterium]|nr:SDR family NAD(P)-dependent oxidoreductase [Muribaculaceae bacterium]
MYWVYSLVSAFRGKRPKSLQRVLVYGVGEKPVALVTRLRKSTHYEVVGFLTYAPSSIERTMLSGLRVRHFQTADDVVRISREMKLDGILFAHPNDVRSEKDRLLRLCQETGLKLFVAPGIDEMTDGKVPGAIRKIRIEDLLGREEIKISMDLIRENVAGKVVLVTGAAGSIGSELCRQLAGLGVAKLVMMDNAETPLHNVRLEFEDRYPGLKFVPVIGDVRSLERLDYVFTHWKPQVVFHAAAYKHVPLMEDNPCEAVLA